jgi:CHASE2 domain-containing sensor protein
MMFLVLGLFSLIPINCLFLDPIAKAISDFDVYDIVYSRIREEPKVDTNIVLVNLSHLSRVEIAEQINIINSYDPKVVALDAIFLQDMEQEVDSILAEAFSRCRNLVLVSKLDRFNEETNSYDSIQTSIINFNRYAANGYANLPNIDEISFRTIREFRPFAQVRALQIPAFGTKIAELYNPAAMEFLSKRKNEIEKINYAGNFNKFYYLDANQVLGEKNDLSFIKGKIILMGFMGINLNDKTFEDIFFTPLNERFAGKAFPDMHGVIIHANIVSMILSKNYVNVMPKWLSIFLSLLLSYLSAYIIYNLKIKFKDWFSGLSKLYILLITVFNLFVGVMVLHHFNYRIDLTLALAVVVLTNTIVEIYQSFISKFFPALEKKSN